MLNFSTLYDLFNFVKNKLHPKRRSPLAVIIVILQFNTYFLLGLFIWKCSFYEDFSILQQQYALISSAIIVWYYIHFIKKATDSMVLELDMLVLIQCIVGIVLKVLVLSTYVVYPVLPLAILVLMANEDLKNSNNFDKYNYFFTHACFFNFIYFLACPDNVDPIFLFITCCFSYLIYKNKNIFVKWLHFLVYVFISFVYARIGFNLIFFFNYLYNFYELNDLFILMPKFVDDLNFWYKLFIVFFFSWVILFGVNNNKNITFINCIILYILWITHLYLIFICFTRLLQLNFYVYLFLISIHFFFFNFFLTFYKKKYKLFFIAYHIVSIFILILIILCSFQYKITLIFVYLIISFWSSILFTNKKLFSILIFFFNTFFFFISYFIFIKLILMGLKFNCFYIYFILSLLFILLTINLVNQFSFSSYFFINTIFILFCYLYIFIIDINPSLLLIIICGFFIVNNYRNSYIYLFQIIVFILFCLFSYINLFNIISIFNDDNLIIILNNWNINYFFNKLYISLFIAKDLNAIITFLFLFWFFFSIIFLKRSDRFILFYEFFICILYSILILLILIQIPSSKESILFIIFYFFNNYIYFKNRNNNLIYISSILFWIFFNINIIFKFFFFNLNYLLIPLSWWTVVYLLKKKKN